MTEILTLEVTLIGGAWAGDRWARVIEIPDTASLGDLHDFIQTVIEFYDDHLFEFYAGRNWRNRSVEFGDPLDLDNYGEYDQILLSEVYPLKGIKLYYLFDFGDDWRFEIKRRRKRKIPQSALSYPRIIEAEGENPQQYPDYES